MASVSSACSSLPRRFWALLFEHVVLAHRIEAARCRNQVIWPCGLQALPSLPRHSSAFQPSLLIGRYRLYAQSTFPPYFCGSCLYDSVPVQIISSPPAQVLIGPCLLGVHREYCFPVFCAGSAKPCDLSVCIRNCSPGSWMHGNYHIWYMVIRGIWQHGCHYFSRIASGTLAWKVVTTLSLQHAPSRCTRKHVMPKILWWKCN
jgi:hypothetical protein